MATFLETSQGTINLDHVTMITRREKGMGAVVHLTGATLLFESADAAKIMTAIHPLRYREPVRVAAGPIGYGPTEMSCLGECDPARFCDTLAVAVEDAKESMREAAFFTGQPHASCEKDRPDHATVQLAHPPNVDPVRFKASLHALLDSLWASSAGVNTR